MIKKRSIEEIAEKPQPGDNIVPGYDSPIHRKVTGTFTDATGEAYVQFVEPKYIKLSQWRLWIKRTSARPH